MLYRYLLREVAGYFFSIFLIFCTVVLISQLMRLAPVLVTFGLSPENIFLPLFYILVPFLSLIIPLAFLFAVMVCFSRLSSDGELTALLASGYSMLRLLRPLMLFALVLYLLGTACSVHLEAWGRREFTSFIARKTQTAIDDIIRFKIQPGVFIDNFLDYVFYTEEVSPDRENYVNTMLAPQQQGQGNFVITAPRARISGSVATGDLRMSFFNGNAHSYNSQEKQGTSLWFEQMDVDLLQVFQERIFGAGLPQDDYRAMTLPDLRGFLHNLELNPNKDESLLRRVNFLWWNRWLQSGLVFSFALFGLILGMHYQRKAKNNAYILAICLALGAFLLLVACRFLAEQGFFSVFFAVYFPQLSLFFFALFCFYRRIRLPPYEPILALRKFSFGSQPKG